LTASKASTLLPYLKGAVSSIEKKSKDDKTTSTEDEQTIADYLLKVFRAAIPHMPKTATGFGQDLQFALQPMILKPSAGLNVSAIVFLQVTLDLTLCLGFTGDCCMYVCGGAVLNA